MSVVLSIYTNNAFRDYLLPAVNNTDYDIILKKSIFRLEDDIALNLEIIDGEWSLLSSEKYRVAGINNGRKKLKSGDIFNVETLFCDGISCMVSETDNSFSVFKKYDLTGIDKLTIGNTPDNDLQYQNMTFVSKHHAILQKAERGFAIRDISKNGTFVNYLKITNSQALRVGDCINIFGLKIVYLGAAIAISSTNEYMFRINISLKELNQESANAKFNPVKREAFHRAPRFDAKPDNEPIEIEAPPAPKVSAKKPLWMSIGPSFTMVIPMLLGSIIAIAGASNAGSGASLYMFTGIFTAASSALVGAFWGVTNIRYSKKETVKEEKLRQEAYSTYLEEKEALIKTNYDKYSEYMSEIYPDVNTVVTYNAKSSALWNRNRRHGDFLSVRIGTGDMEFPVEINVPKEKFSLIKDYLSDEPKRIKEKYKYLKGVPITIDLYANRLFGIAGGKNKEGCQRVIKNIVAQLTACNCYTDVKLVLIYDRAKSEENYEYMYWLPHVWSEDKKTRYIASNKVETSDVFYELLQIFRRRTEAESSKKVSLPKPFYVMIIVNPELLEGEPIAKYIYNAEPCCGLTTFLFADSAENLPNECENIICCNEDKECVYNVSDENEQYVKFDLVSDISLENFARAILPIQVSETEAGNDVPNSLSFFEMYGVAKLSDFNVEENWKKNRTYETMRAMIGVKAGEMPCYLDIHEKYHGPHGLVAGTTGSGKSETLQTYMLSLALNYSPDDIGYFIIDFKGGGMAGLFDGLPHLIGSISNLSGNQVRRAMISIKSENRRRQKIFTENNVNNINLYTKLYKNGEVKTPLPHMFIIVDEFAELKREEPEFMKELISVAQVGRSLGVHLILSTQKPNGTVDDNIWSNSKFRLCLRVQDKQDSNDMLHKPDAAYITQTGRGYLQVGNDEVYELFQSGYSGAIYDESADSTKTEVVSIVTTNGKNTLIGNYKRTKEVSAVQKIIYSEKKKKTQLDAVVEYLAKIANKEGYKQQMQLWLPPLSDIVYIDQIVKEDNQIFDGKMWKRHEKWELSGVIGITDDPENQAQLPLSVDLAQSGNIAVIASVTGGKSTFLQTLIYEMLCRYSPDYINFYAIDFSSRMLSCFADSPHFGGVLYEDDSEKIAKLFFMLDKIIGERKKLLNGGTYAQYIRANGVKLPMIEVVIDNIGAFREKTDGKYDDMLTRMFREGIGYGIQFIVTALGFSSAEINSKMSDSFKTSFAIQLNDNYSYCDVLRTNHIEVLPESNVKGRGLAKAGDNILEYQTALAFRAEDDYRRLEMLKELCCKMQNAWEGTKAMAVPFIPEKPIWADFERLDSYKEFILGRRYLPIGYDTNSASVYGVDLSKTFVYLISEKGKSGKTMLQKAVINSAVQMGGRIVVIEPASSELKNTAETAGAEYIVTKAEQSDFFRDNLELIKGRNIKKRALVEEGKDDMELFEEMQAEQPIFIVISDIADFVLSVNRDEIGIVDIKNFVRNVFEKGSMLNIYFFVGINQDNISGIIGNVLYSAITSYHEGIHFGGMADGIRYMDFSNFTFNERNKTKKAGIGMLPVANGEEAREVVIPLIKR